jgi:hypothetical protein
MQVRGRVRPSLQEKIMPIESASDERCEPNDSSAGALYLAASRNTLRSALAKICHCLEQLSEEDVQWRAFEAHNSIQNIVLHLCGNLRQWIVHGVGGAPDRRDRAREFSERTPIPKTELLRRLRETVSEADRVLSAMPAERLTEVRRVQGFEVTVLEAILDSASHFVGHVHQIVYITRLRLGDAYRFHWVPDERQQRGADVGEPDG